jgi:Transcription factor WhiB
MKEAKCAPENGGDPDIFFPAKGRVAQANLARFTCYQCPVQEQCRNYQRETGSEYGIWAGEFASKDD